MRTAPRGTSLLAVLVMLVAACGQKPGVHERRTQTQTVQVGEPQPQAAEPEAPAAEPEAQAESAPGSAAPGAAPGGAPGGAPAAPGGAGPQAAGTGGGEPADRTGVSDAKIVLGLHAPLTGAAAVPLADIQYGVDVYRKWLNAKGVKVHGREIEIRFKDDQYNPSHAVSVCRELVERDKVFALIGAAGTDQIQACARYAASVGVPYLSFGVTENVVSGLKNYFAFTMSYPDQAKPLAELIRNLGNGFAPQPPAGQQYGGGPVLVDRCNESAVGGTACAPSPGAPGSNSPKVGVVYSDTEAFHDARDAFVSQMGGGVTTYPITKFNISSTDASTVVQQLKKEGIDVAYILTSPTNWLSILSQANTQQYYPRWVGVGLTMGINTVATVACAQNRQTFENSLMLSPWFSVNKVSGDPSSAQFAEAWRAYGNGDGNPLLHDIAFGLWGATVVLHVMFESAGPDLSRQSFVASLAQLRNASAASVIKTVPGGVTDVYSRLSFSGSNRFGADQVHVLWASCPLGQPGFWNYFENGQFRSGF